MRTAVSFAVSILFFFVTGIHAQETFILRYPAEGQFCAFGSAVSPQNMAGITGYSIEPSGSQTVLGTIRPNGSLASFKTYASGRIFTSLSMALASDGGFVIGGNSFHQMSGVDRVVLFRTTPTGGLRWKKNISSSTNTNVYAISAVTGGFIVAGSTGNRGSQDFLIMKIDPAGNLLWSKAIGDSGVEFVLSVTALSDGGIIAAGEKDSQPVIVRIDSNGNVVWIRRLSSAPFTEDTTVKVAGLTDGSFAVSATIMGSANPSIFLTKLSNNGSRFWSKRFSSGTAAISYDVIASADGGMIVSGQYGLDAPKPLILKVTSNGSTQWKMVYSQDEGSARTAAEFADGTILVSGCLQTERQELFAMRLNSKGTIGSTCTPLRTAPISVASQSLTLQTLSLPVSVPQVTVSQATLTSVSRNAANMAVCSGKMIIQD